MGLKEHAERVHVVCEYMRKVRGERGNCKECPHWGKDRRYGKVQRGCRGLAEEIMSVVIHGKPWPPRWKPIDPLTGLEPPFSSNYKLRVAPVVEMEREDT